MTGYAVSFNLRHRRSGHLFQNRYKSIVCQEDSYLTELVRYIHLNLIRAGIAKGLGELNRSPWSGHSALMGYQKTGVAGYGVRAILFWEGGREEKKILEVCEGGN